MSTFLANYAVGAAWLAVLATGVSALALIALHPLSPEFHPSWRMVSEYANGHYRSVLTVVFLSWALSSFALVVALGPSAKGWVGVIGLLVLVLAGIGEAMGGLFDVNHRLHGVAFGLGVPSLFIAAILLTIAGRRAGLEIPAWSAALPIVSVVVMAASMMMFFSALKAAGINITAESKPLSSLPDGVTAWCGYANRFVFATYYLWVIMAARAVLQK